MFSDIEFVVAVYCTYWHCSCHPMQCIVRVYSPSIMIMFIDLNCVNRVFSSYSVSSFGCWSAIRGISFKWSGSIPTLMKSTKVQNPRHYTARIGNTARACVDRSQKVHARTAKSMQSQSQTMHCCEKSRQRSSSKPK